MLYPWMAPAAQNSVALREGLKIVRKVIARDAKTGLSTAQIFRLAVRESPPPTYGLALESVREKYADVMPDPAVAVTQYGRAGRRRVPPPGPPNPRHPVRSISFLKHRILPIILGERYVQRTREKRVVDQTPAEEARAVRGKRQEQQSTTPAKPPPELTVYLWKATRPPAHEPPVKVEPVTYKGDDYDFSHMKPAKRKARRARIELSFKRMELDTRRKAKRTEVRRKIEREERERLRAAGRALHEAAERAGLEAKAARRKAWEAANPKLAREAARVRAEEQKRLGLDPVSLAAAQKILKKKNRA
ncbi:hypothetical protein B0H15DRAFT_283013 [Mycena belliarum]|uniref:Uncharacterized protein n=1 Tax=Mycena belliarum TaxID=1033014 RepID=A0AAD6U6W4_9AGAR|nr:hypothetical protein B0H15DRAFT_283013 [Mycena belliae]